MTHLLLDTVNTRLDKDIGEDTLTAGRQYPPAPLGVVSNL